jgi:hypothetical protein
MTGVESGADLVSQRRATTGKLTDMCANHVDRTIVGIPVNMSTTQTEDGGFKPSSVQRGLSEVFELTPVQNEQWKLRVAHIEPFVKLAIS